MQNTLVLVGSSAAAGGTLAERAGGGCGVAVRVRGGASSALTLLTGATRGVGRDAVGAVAGAGGGSGAGTEGHVQTGSTQGAENSGVAGDLDISLHGVAGGVDVRVVAGGSDSVGSRVASNIDLADGSVVVTGILDILAVPVNLTTSPGDSTGGVAGLTGGPEGHLQAGGGLGVLVLLGGRVVGIGLQEGAHHGAVDDPLQLVGLPVDLVGVPVIEGILAAHGGVGAVVPCNHSQLVLSHFEDADMGSSSSPHTIKNTLPVVVGLHSSEVGTDPLVVDLVLDIGQQDESGHDTLATAGLDLSRDLAVPDVVVVGEKSSDRLLGHGHEKGAVLNLGETAVGPIGRAGIAQVLGVEDGVVEVVPGVALAFTDRHGSA